jgi:hypothetical protein
MTNKFEIGQEWRTAKGRAVIVDINEDGQLLCWHEGRNATSLHNSGGEHICSAREHDLIAPWSDEPKVMWINVYPHGAFSNKHPTKEEADKWADETRIARIKVEYYEGQFDE